MPSAGFEPAIPEIERLQTYALDRRAAGFGPVRRSVSPNLSLVQECYMVQEQNFYHFTVTAKFGKI